MILRVHRHREACPGEHDKVNGFDVLGRISRYFSQLIGRTQALLRSPSASHLDSRDHVYHGISQCVYYISVHLHLESYGAIGLSQSNQSLLVVLHIWSPGHPSKTLAV